MGNTPKNTATYFPHFIGKGRKIQTIDHRYGNDGYATWYRLLEMLCQANGHYLLIKSDEDLMYLASYCRISNAMLNDILSDLATMGEIDREFLSHGVIWSRKFSESLRPLYKKRVGGCMTREQVAAAVGIELVPEKKKASKPREKKVKEVPSVEEFLEHCKTIPGINYAAYEHAFRSKYEAWVSNGWKDGYGKEIKDWKSKIKNVLPHLKPMYTAGNRPVIVKQTSANSADATNWSSDEE